MDIVCFLLFVVWIFLNLRNQDCSGMQNEVINIVVRRAAKEFGSKTPGCGDLRVLQKTPGAVHVRR